MDIRKRRMIMNGEMILKKSSSKGLAFAFCGLIMTIIAVSDALRGVFLPQFRETFSLTESQGSRIIMVSYVGNLLFLSIGGYISDRVPKKRFIGGVIALWSAALAVYVFTENYYILMFAMMFSMGGSTMLSTSINLVTSVLFLSPAMMVSIFNFLQGAGITAAQNIGGRFAGDIANWHYVNLILLVLAAVCLVLLWRLDIPEEEKSADKDEKPKNGLLMIFGSPAGYLLIPICGCYFVAEHGMMNWLTSYGSEYLGYTVEQSAVYLSLFFGGITIGRLVFAPVIDKLGIFRCLMIWSAVGAAFYVAAIVLGKEALFLIGISGLGFSIIYPMLVMLIGKYYDPSVSGSVTGGVLSVATFFDIGFNAFFGKAVESFGYGISIMVLPVTALLCSVLIFVLKFTVRRSAEIR